MDVRAEYSLSPSLVLSFLSLIEMSLTGTSMVVEDVCLLSGNVDFFVAFCVTFTFDDFVMVEDVVEGVEVSVGVVAVVCASVLFVVVAFSVVVVVFSAVVIFTVVGISVVVAFAVVTFDLAIEVLVVSFLLV